MVKKDKQVAHAIEDPTHAALHQQKTQLVNTFNELATSMRKAAHDAEVMANTVATLNLSEGSRAVLQRNATEMLKAVQGPPATAPKSPQDDTAMSGVVVLNPKKRPHPSVAERKSAEAAVEDAASPEATVVTNGKKEKKEKEKKPKVKRDPNMPKKPASAYLLFQNDIRATIKEQHPELKNAMLLQEISKSWQSIPEETKAKYQAKVDEQKVIYNGEMNKYNLTKGDTTAAGGATPAPKPVKVLPTPSAKASPDKPTPAKAAPIASTPIAAARQPPTAAAASTTTDDDAESTGESGSGESTSEESEEEDDDDDEEDDDNDEEEVEQPPPAKKHKSQPDAPPIASVQSAKKSHKK